MTTFFRNNNTVYNTTFSTPKVTGFTTHAVEKEGGTVQVRPLNKTEKRKRDNLRQYELKKALQRKQREEERMEEIKRCAQLWQELKDLSYYEALRVMKRNNSLFSRPSGPWWEMLKGVDQATEVCIGDGALQVGTSCYHVRLLIPIPTDRGRVWDGYKTYPLGEAIKRCLFVNEDDRAAFKAILDFC